MKNYVTKLPAKKLATKRKNLNIELTCGTIIKKYLKFSFLILLRLINLVLHFLFLNLKLLST